ncbi:MAG TPA: GFA family protein [Caulobacteraceae bacterium]|nr:GFA family protein [Caulobacteraceae bacterium]
MSGARFTGGCLCGQVRYVAEGEPTFTGHCYCRDCQRASGSGFIPFMGFPASALTFNGETRRSVVPTGRGGDAVRNHCAVCGGLVFGGIVGVDTEHTIYAGSLDEPSRFKPQIAIFASRRPPWALIPEGLAVFDEMPG